jgi:hypothetical protein
MARDARRSTSRSGRPLHTGEVEVVGDDIRGLAVHLPSRLLALVGPGEIFTRR